MAKQPCVLTDTDNGIPLALGGKGEEGKEARASLSCPSQLTVVLLSGSYGDALLSNGERLFQLTQSVCTHQWTRAVQIGRTPQLLGTPANPVLLVPWDMNAPDSAYAGFARSTHSLWRSIENTGYQVEIMDAHRQPFVSLLDRIDLPCVLVGIDGTNMLAARLACMYPYRFVRLVMLGYAPVVTMSRYIKLDKNIRHGSVQLTGAHDLLCDTTPVSGLLQESVDIGTHNRLPHNSSLDHTYVWKGASPPAMAAAGDEIKESPIKKRRSSQQTPRLYLPTDTWVDIVWFKSVWIVSALLSMCSALLLFAGELARPLSTRALRYVCSALDATEENNNSSSSSSKNNKNKNSAIKHTVRTSFTQTVKSLASWFVDVLLAWPYTATLTTGFLAFQQQLHRHACSPMPAASRLVNTLDGAPQEMQWIAHNYLHI
jgi:hypothetical protein